MGVMAYPLRYALADLALALSRVSDNAAEVRSTAARAAADMIGDGAGVQLLGDDGRYDSITYHHIDDERSTPLSRVLDHVGQLPDDDFSTTLAASRRPIVLAGDGVEPLAGDEHQIHAAVLCPVIVDNTYAG
jgi:two-component system cell cycle sensor histidine kinase/response regulator CckA